MAAVIATLKGKVLLQFGDAEPVEVGTVEIPIHAGTEHPKHTRGRELSSTEVTITTHTPDACARGKSMAACILHYTHAEG